jgi:lysophospholipase L1-like esterase
VFLTSYQDNEGWEGYTVRQVHEMAKPQYRMIPNVVLINAGTNDCRGGIEPETQPNRMRDMVRDILDNVPGVTIIVSGLVPHKDDTVDACARDMDERYFQMVRRDFIGEKVLPVRLVSAQLRDYSGI